MEPAAADDSAGSAQQLGSHGDHAGDADNGLSGIVGDGAGETKDELKPDQIRAPVVYPGEVENKNFVNRSEVTGEGPAYIPDPDGPNARFLPKEYETRVEVIQKFPEMKIIEETVFIKEVYYEERTITVPRTKVIMEENVVIDKVPVIRQVPKTRIEIVHRIVEEPREITEMVEVVEYMEIPRVEKTPRIITEDVLETVSVPVVREVPLTRQIEVPTGNYIEKLHNRYTAPGDMNLLRNLERKVAAKLNDGLHRNLSNNNSESVSSSGRQYHAADSEAAAEVSTTTEAAHTPPHSNGSSEISATTSARQTTTPKKGLLKRLEHRFSSSHGHTVV